MKSNVKPNTQRSVSPGLHENIPYLPPDLPPEFFGDGDALFLAIFHRTMTNKGNDFFGTNSGIVLILRPETKNRF
jgi:hypothetical protein